MNLSTVPGIDIFTGTPSESSAAEFETRSIQISAVKPLTTAVPSTRIEKCGAY
jgi:hypothetical protein